MQNLILWEVTVDMGAELEPRSHLMGTYLTTEPSYSLYARLFCGGDTFYVLRVYALLCVPGSLLVVLRDMRY